MVIMVYTEVVDLTSWGTIVSLSGKAVSQEETRQLQRRFCEVDWREGGRA